MSKCEDCPPPSSPHSPTPPHPPQLNEGKVVAVGPGRRLANGDLVTPGVKEGDKVLLPEFGGQPIKLQDKEYSLFREDELLGVLR